MTGQPCLIELKKAFDTLSHEIFIAQVDKLRFQGKNNQVLIFFD